MSDEDFEVVLINQCRDTSMPITFSNSKNGPVDIEIIVEDDSCLLKKKLKCIKIYLSIFYNFFLKHFSFALIAIMSNK